MFGGLKARSRSDGPEVWQMGELGRQYPSRCHHSSSRHKLGGSVADDVNAWSVYRQNLNSEFTDSALGSSDKSPLPQGSNFQLRESATSAMLTKAPRPPHSQVGANMFTYLKHGLPRVFPPALPDNSSGYDSSEEGSPADQQLDGNRPRLQAHRVGCERRGAAGWRRLLDEVTFEARGGDLVGVLTTSGEIPPGRLAERLTYVQCDRSLAGAMSVRQTLLFYAFLQEPGHVARCFNIKNKITALLDDLGLGQVKHTCVRELTDSERCRLSVACHLCLETDLVLLDQPTRHMDIFDTFFLVEYLRQWAARGRIVLLTLQPPTYEVFSLLTRVLLLSGQRVIYSGKRSEMLPYFAFIDYPCPAYKNPSDYYLDLVTLDELSPEARLESSQRVAELAEAYQRRQEEAPEPLLALGVQALVYQFPHNAIRLAVRMMVACTMSVIVGTIFIGIRGEDHDQENVPDRVGFHYAMMSLALWPTLLLTVSSVWRDKDVVTGDVSDRLYSRVCHTFVAIMLDLPGAALECLLLTGPAQKMAGTQPADTATSFYVYTGYMLVYLLCVRLLAVAAGYACSSRHQSAGWLGAVLLPLLLAAGGSLHPHDLSPWTHWLRWVSAPAWIFQRLVWNELAHVRRLRCDRNPVMPQNGTILVQVECGLAAGPQALRFLAVEDERTPLLPLES
ncbi:ATP-binding cassette sub-family G member 8-like [Pollicipes pollicipes]|uniref:ATP-binding cassette sub-family G member 8-like n=1 Tax=Pollicipes pollicipes TaxID=41117 RepID=UPI001884CA3A|nr:ATP-binding cassette sub-family G member 8-like [Pollicipes pollicipes]